MPFSPLHSAEASKPLVGTAEACELISSEVEPFATVNETLDLDSTDSTKSFREATTNSVAHSGDNESNNSSITLVDSTEDLICSVNNLLDSNESGEENAADEARIPLLESDKAIKNPVDEDREPLGRLEEPPEAAVDCRTMDEQAPSPFGHHRTSGLRGLGTELRSVKKRQSSLDG